MKVYNTNNHSDYSDEITATTSVAKIPSPLRVSYDPEGGTLAINVGATCLALVASIEKSDSGSDNTWRIVDDWPLEVLGSASTQREGILDDPAASSSEPRIRVRLCLKADRQRCGDYVEAESEYPHLYASFNSFGARIIGRRLQRVAQSTLKGKTCTPSLDGISSDFCVSVIHGVCRSAKSSGEPV